MKNLLTIAAVTAMASLPLAAGAMTVTYTVNMNGANEVPPNASPAVGSGQFTIDDVAGTISYAFAAFSLATPVTVYHIHGPAPLGGTAVPVIDLAPLADVTGPVMIATFAVPGSFAAATTSAKTIPVGVATMINAAPSLFYVNVHTFAHGGGEIRGQLAPVPEPATFGMLALGLAGIGFAVRRRGKQG